MPDTAPNRRKWWGVAAAAVAVALVGSGIYGRIHAEQHLASVAAGAAVPTVNLIAPKPGTNHDTLTLPANLQALNNAPIYARTSGYVRQWLVNIGDTVHRGQVLAVLDAPEVEQQLAAAQADLQTARANQQLANTTAQRWSQMLSKDAVSQQETDEKRGELAARTAVTAAAQANVRRLQATIGFTRLRAPFDGIVTTRNAEIGALVTAGNAGAQPLFVVADVNRIRALVRVPQGYSADVKPGMEVTLALPEYPGRTFTATMTRSAGAVDPSSGTVLVELQASNGDRALKPGAYAQASFPIHGGGNALTLPPSALMVGQDGTRVAVLRADGKAELRKITIGRDLGKSIEVSAGLSPNDRVIDSPPESLQTGDPVRVAQGGANAR
ncbi:efflux RND transporter periplasmic adaptor subunit [Sphingomonas sp. HITSZ_GF]|uniref:efflux RND transporter periplasmic adaptor subunit n=1 Tax=Sphingomonas sp. HITSZ_GF TaxID=3037247 RepID=UPI00240D5D1E|nr:efflux RND transporter periplasmic adaptor subunit [Sphingomonas sp. HITSZ_GF]MDG2535907.1 efflux RND transporter periplasmic adaptor subunit [Sphingomonas sp. HITSZ_GF]